ncbi:hypothetical protein AJ80_09932 [Polytolypa hystricis UAMH7299]|uniref:Uncharacterized protein n=1 Tax=Polytolypa hystricis (strain UAMH7299) TaxID=1447883 RepID=A0A2B7WG84_POLH7|nr:hypothetical protein AJ80_09932 [Polytolypa hystricis UAMH7299]
MLTGLKELEEHRNNRSMDHSGNSEEEEDGDCFHDDSEGGIPSRGSATLGEVGSELSEVVKCFHTWRLGL